MLLPLVYIFVAVPRLHRCDLLIFTIKLTALNAFRFRSLVNFLVSKRQKTFLSLSCLYSANIAATASSPIFEYFLKRSFG